MNVLLSGCNGAMGLTLQQVIGATMDLNVVAGYDSRGASNDHFPVYQNLEDVKETLDVLIDFSHYSAFEAITDFALSSKIPLVMATTGLQEEQEKKLLKMAQAIPVFRTANMSIGVNVMVGLVTQAEALLQGFDIEILEKHHNKKQDAPSGTALMLANAIQSSAKTPYQFVYGRHGTSAKRTEKEIGIHAIRGGTIAGEHTVLYAGEDEIVEITHIATSKRVFAQGAVEAARFITQQPAGLYDMKKLLGFA